MNQFEVPACLEDTLPEITEAMLKKEASSDISDLYKSVQCLTDFTFKIAHEHNIKTLKRCFMAGERLYTRGNTMIRNAVENVFIYSFSRLFADCTDKAERTRMQSLVPLNLYSAYVQQILKSNY